MEYFSLQDVWLEIWSLSCSVAGVIFLTFSFSGLIYVSALTWLLLLGVQIKITSFFPSLINCV